MYVRVGDQEFAVPRSVALEVSHAILRVTADYPDWEVELNLVVQDGKTKWVVKAVRSPEV